MRLGAHAEGHVQQAGRLIAAYELRGSTVGFVAVLRLQVTRAEGRYDEAFAAAEDARRELQESNPTRLPVVALYEGLVWLDLGQPARARPRPSQLLHGFSRRSQSVRSVNGDAFSPAGHHRARYVCQRLSF